MAHIFTIFLSIILQNIIIDVINGEIYLRKHNERGPIAVQSAVKCINSIGDIYFKNLQSKQIPNLAVINVPNITSPAVDILENFLDILHTEMIEGDVKTKIRVYTMENEFEYKKVIKKVVLAPIDYYVLVVDDYDTVSKI